MVFSTVFLSDPFYFPYLFLICQISVLNVIFDYADDTIFYFYSKHLGYLQYNSLLQDFDSIQKRQSSNN